MVAFAGHTLLNGVDRNLIRDILVPLFSKTDVMNALIKISVLFTAAILLSWFTPLTDIPLLHAEELTSPRQQAQELQKFYNSLTSITFDFSQISRTGGRERSGRGNAVFVKPEISGKSTSAAINQRKSRSIMRWNYTEPDKQVIINDGTILSIYTDKDRQLIKTSARELESDITYAFFAGTRDLLEDFEALPANSDFIFSSAENLQIIKLVPRQPHNQIRAVFIWSDNNNIIHHMLIEDHFDSTTELNFENIAFNSLQITDEKTIDSIISFSIPPGTEIIQQ
ncbi:MAG: outer membrane lipoprotein carrier protein LolA [Desulfobulbaceae bacterium]|nr:outer membrane lipoprotein carrier protein LolA [Desulfobulbaceae bacterium]